MGPECQEELPACQVPQLATRPERLPDDVHDAQDREDGQVHGRPRGVWAPCGLPLPRSGPSGNKQLLSDKGEPGGKHYVIFSVKFSWI